MLKETKVKQTGYEFFLPCSASAHAPTPRPRRIAILDGDKTKPRLTTKERSGCNGFGLATDNVSYTVTVRDRHMVGVFK